MSRSSNPQKSTHSLPGLPLYKGQPSLYVCVLTLLILKFNVVAVYIMESGNNTLTHWVLTSFYKILLKRFNVVEKVLKQAALHPVKSVVGGF